MTYKIIRLFFIFSLFKIYHCWEARITNASLIDSEDAPFFITIVHEYSTCGATLITLQWIMTAAHCYRREWTVRRPKAVTGMVGSHNEIFRWIDKTTKHDRYEEINGKYYHDIALCIVDEPFQISEFTAVAKLPAVNHLDGEDVRTKYAYCTVYGIGSPFPEGKPAGKVKDTRQIFRTNLPVISEFICRKTKTGREMNPPLIPKCHLCLQYYPGYRGTCTTDAGGPVICGKFFIGIVSLNSCISNRCEKPHIFTRVDYYIRWIVENVPDVEIVIEDVGDLAMVDLQKSSAMKYKMFNLFILVMLSVSY